MHEIIYLCIISIFYPLYNESIIYPSADMQFAGRNVRICVDTGSIFSHMSRQYVNFCKLSTNKLGIATIIDPQYDMKLNGVSVTYDPFAIRDFPLPFWFPFHAIVGCNFMRDNHLILDYSIGDSNKNCKVLCSNIRYPERAINEVQGIIYAERENRVYGFYILVNHMGKKYTLLIDSGSSHTIVNTDSVQVANELKRPSLSVTYHQHFTNRSYSLSKCSSQALIASVRIDCLYTASLGSMLDKHEQNGIKCIGIYGNDNLVANKLIIDFSNSRIYTRAK